MVDGSPLHPLNPVSSFDPLGLRGEKKHNHHGEHRYVCKDASHSCEITPPQTPSKSQLEPEKNQREDRGNTR